MLTSPKISFSCKAKTLEDLSPMLKNGKVLPLLRFRVTDYHNHPSDIYSKAFKKLKSSQWIIRSSAQSEDSQIASNAGRYVSKANILANDEASFHNAVNAVIKSYDIPHPNDEVFIQPMLLKAPIFGVIFTADGATGAPYYIIEFDEEGKHDVITGGISRGNVVVCHKKDLTLPRAPWLRHLMSACKECEELFSNPHLDLEFAIDTDHTVYILQVRPMTSVGNVSEHLDFENTLDKIERKIHKIFHPHPYLLGNKGMLGVMPDWNPAEIIGLKPRPLALSLYKELVTDSVWAYQRDNYGYRNLRSHPLLISLMGVPLIDVRASLNSFIPANLEDGLAKRLMEYYLNKLRKQPHHHDKIEFEIALSCYHFDTDTQLRDLITEGFSESDCSILKTTLLKLTKDIICPSSGLYQQDLAKINILKKHHQTVLDSGLPIIDKIYWLIEDCKRYGTLPFAGIARAAFVAMQMLRSFVTQNIWSPEDYEQFMSSLNTVSKRLSNDLTQLNNEDDGERFLSEYGHLRPGTYDICSLRYDEDLDQYFGHPPQASDPVKKFSLSQQQSDALTSHLNDHHLKISPQSLMQFITESIEGREHAKFVFTKTLSMILQLLTSLGENHGLTRDDMSYLPISAIMELYASLDHQTLLDKFSALIKKNKEAYRYTTSLRLPTLIVDPSDIRCFETMKDEPSYITLKKIRAQVVVANTLSHPDVNGQIVCIPSADPGYDYLFAKGIGGLITEYGGVNSHMAIRCAELGIPAVIGAGNRNFALWSQAHSLEIDAHNKKTTVLA